MKNYLLITTAGLLLSFGASQASAQDAPTKVPRCDSTVTMSSTDQFLAVLNLPPSAMAKIELWNGCFRVDYMDSDNKNVTEYYDPITMMMPD